MNILDYAGAISDKKYGVNAANYDLAKVIRHCLSSNMSGEGKLYQIDNIIKQILE